MSLFRDMVDRTAAKWEKRFAGEVERQFDADHAALVESLSAHKAKVDWIGVEQSWQEIYAERRVGWRDAFVPLIKGVVTEQGNRANLAFGMTFDVQNLFALKWFDEYLLTFSQPICDTSEQQLSYMLQNAHLQGWSIPQMEKEMDFLFDIWTGKKTPGIDETIMTPWIQARRPRYRRELIARTETIRASNVGLHSLYDQWGMPKKQWWATGDSRTRRTHMQAWQDYQVGGRVGPIDMKAFFHVGVAEMAYPGDPIAPIEEFANCRCSVLPYDPKWDMPIEEAYPVREPDRAESEQAPLSSPGLVGPDILSFMKSDSDYSPQGEALYNQEGLVLNGVPLKTEAVPNFGEIRDAVDEKPPTVPGGFSLSTGIVVVEPDGRVWIYEPKNHYGGYEHSFPKGRKEPGLSYQQNAMKEVYEELGLKTEIISVLGDYKGTSTVTRFYIGKRTGGTPWSAGWEADNVKLVTMAQARQLLNMPRDRSVWDDLKKYLDDKGPPGMQEAPIQTLLDLVEDLAEDSPGTLGDMFEDMVETLDDLAEEDREFPPAFEDLVDVKGLGGSTGARLMRDPVSGKLFVAKRGNSPAHILSEFRANNAYRALGVNVPNARMYDTNSGPVQVAEFIEGESLEGKTITSDIRKKLQKGFVADALMGNWDVMGAAYDNILIDSNGEIWRIDNGGSLSFRAQGSTKGKAWQGEPTELWTMRDPAVSRQAGAIYKGMKWSTINSQLLAATKKKVREEVLASLDADDRKIMATRLDESRRIYNLTRKMRKDKFDHFYLDSFCKHSVGLRAAGIVDSFPKRLRSQGSRRVVLYDDSGQRWDNIREHGISYAVSEYMSRNGGDYGIITGYADDQAGSSWSGKPAALKYFFGSLVRKVPQKNFYWGSGYDSCLREWKNLVAANGQDRVMDTLSAFHALNYEFLKNVDIGPRANRRSEIIELARTENNAVMRLNGVYNQQRGLLFPRGGLESASLFDTVIVAGDRLTLQEVPFHRVFGGYWFSQRPGSTGGLFAGDSENELTFMPEGIEFDYWGSVGRHEDLSSYWDWYKKGH